MVSFSAARTPFQISFRSDGWEPVEEATIGGANANRGFQLIYFMDSNNCNSASFIPWFFNLDVFFICHARRIFRNTMEWVRNHFQGRSAWIKLEIWQQYWWRRRRGQRLTCDYCANCTNKIGMAMYCNYMRIALSHLNTLFWRLGGHVSFYCTSMKRIWCIKCF